MALGSASITSPSNSTLSSLATAHPIRSRHLRWDRGCLDHRLLYCDQTTSIRPAYGGAVPPGLPLPPPAPWPPPAGPPDGGVGVGVTGSRPGTAGVCAWGAGASWAFGAGAS